MISMKKTAMAAALAMTMGAGAAQAAPVVNFSFVGNFTMLSSAGGLVGQDPNVTGSMTMDFGTGTGSAAISSPQTFFGYVWTAHDITLTAIGPGTVRANMLFDWAVNSNISVQVDFSMAPSYCAGITCMEPGSVYVVTTLDGSDPNWIPAQPDGIPGYPMDNGPFIGFNATFNGNATVVPVPAAVWLMGSGLLGLVGVARRKKAA